MTAYFNEYDPKAAAWLRELIRRGLIADGVVDERSILDVQPDDLRGFTQCHFFAGIGGWSYALRLAGWPDDQPVWTGSPPCQPFSSAGQMKGKDDERHLAPHFAALVAAVRPPILFGEQVASSQVFGKASGRSERAPTGEPEWAWLDDLSGRLEAAHYAVGASDIPAAGIGAPHIRQRTFFGAIRLADAHSGSEGVVGDGDSRLGGGGAWDARVGHRSSSSAVGLADSLHAGRAERRARAGDGQASGGRGGLCGLALPHRGERDGLTDGQGREFDGSEAGWQQGDGQPERSGERGGLADPDRERHAGLDTLLRTEEGGRDARAVSKAARSGEGSGSDALDGFWSSPDWLFCRDGKWRPVMSGSFPLASGVPARVVRLRGYGNAIVPQAAARFIQAFTESVEHLRLDLSILAQDEEDIFG